MATKTKNSKILYMVELAILTALVVVLQLVGSFVKIGALPMSFVLVPIVIGACLLGAKAGAFLGFVFGLITMIAGISGTDPFSWLLWDADPVVFVAICILKATLAGLGAGLIYKGLGKAFGGKYKLVQAVLASISAPIINTGIFCAGMLIFYFGALPTMFPDAVAQFGGSAVKFIFIGCAGVNFIGEFLVNLVLSPAMVRIIDVVKKKMR